MKQRFEISLLAYDQKAPLVHPAEGFQRIERYTFSPLHEARKTCVFRLFMNLHILKEVCSAVKHTDSCSFKTYYREILSYSYHITQVLPRIRKIVAEDQIDVVYTYWCTPCTLAALSLKKEFPTLKVITRFHGYDLYEERTSIRWQPFRNFVAARADRLVFASQAGEQYFLSRWGSRWPQKRITAYLGSRSMGQFQPCSDGTLRLVSCSNAIPLKRVHLIIDALAALPAGYRVEWHHIGDGTELDALRVRSREAFREHPDIRWTFHGYVVNDQLEALYHSICPDVFITTTSTEGGVPVSIQEAFSMGIPAIATAVGGIPEIVRTGETGFLLPEEPSVQEISAAVRSMYESTPAQRGAMRSAAFRLWREQFDAVRNADRFATFLDHI
ncbi:glycosyltransferase [Pseudoflavonifractor phocaeensis]|uniref:glycosyltransferase n=1 Tax=Pseudoflavonifractor phocaeensis TaxID=1870988 RepID=UPI001F390CCA|nr:glycosyltransferase [Pseudoflavonifractor phocaeensis]MCF2661512.1 glycosyltransferase [Pseudoflavonifractor phocaeensis]